METFDYQKSARPWRFNELHKSLDGTNLKDNHGGMHLSGENEETLDTSKYNYRYYYCKVKTSDGDYRKDIITGVSDLSYYNYQNDESINFLDVSLLLMHLGESVIAENEKYDINEDGVINIADASILLNSDLYGINVWNNSIILPP